MEGGIEIRGVVVVHFWRGGYKGQGCYSSSLYVGGRIENRGVVV